MTDLTSASLADAAEEFYGLANDLAYHAAGGRFRPQNMWSAAERARWSKLITIATLISDLSDEVASDDEPGVEAPDVLAPTITQEDG